MIVQQLIERLSTLDPDTHVLLTHGFSGKLYDVSDTLLFYVKEAGRSQKHDWEIADSDDPDGVAGIILVE